MCCPQSSQDEFCQVLSAPTTLSAAKWPSPLYLMKFSHLPRVVPPSNEANIEKAGASLHKLQCSLDPDLVQWLKLHAKHLNMTPTQVVTVLLEWARSEDVLEDFDLGVLPTKTLSGKRKAANSLMTLPSRLNAVTLFPPPTAGAHHKSRLACTP
jgi:hypothetical protein